MKKGSIKGNIGGLAPEGKKHWTLEYPLIIEGLKTHLMKVTGRKTKPWNGKDITYNDGHIKVTLRSEKVRWWSGIEGISRNNDVLYRNLHKSDLEILEPNLSTKTFHIQGERHSGIIECESRSKAHDLFLEQYPFEDVINIKPVRDKKLAV